MADLIAPSNTGLDEIASQQLLGSMTALTSNPLINILYSDEFPDVLQNYSTDKCKELLDLLVDCPNNLINKKGPLGGYTALHWMAIKNELSLIEFLVTKCKADINSAANLGETSLLICIKNCNIYTVDLMITLGADLNVRDIYKRSILHWSAYSGKVLWFYYFQKHHNIASFNDVDQFLQNPLHIACASGYVEMAKFLIESGDLDLFAQDVNGNNVMHMASRAALTRICWLIAQQNKGDAVRLITVMNKQKQRPYDIIRNEKGHSHKKIRNWLNMELLTNPLVKNQATVPIKSDEFKTFTKPELTMTEKAIVGLKITPKQHGWLEWFIRFISFFLILSGPVSVNAFLMPKEFSLLKGLVGFSTFPIMFLMFSKQKHRINHICGYENSYFLGFFLGAFIHNYFSYYFFIIDSFNLFRLSDFLVLILSMSHAYFFYRLVFLNPGFARENLKKSDGSPYNVKDLMETNSKPKAMSTKDSINWMSEASTNKSAAVRPYFCESCVLIQALPSKHCKLCEACCSKFDHHCLFINKCVGLKNHRPFIFLVAVTWISIFFYLFQSFHFLKNYEENLNVKSLPDELQGSFIYYALSDTTTIWLCVMFLVDIFGVFMTAILLFFQMKFISLGYTQQFPHPAFFTKINKRMATLRSALIHRLENLYIFFFETCEANEQLYYRQQSEYLLSAKMSNVIPLDDYPRNSDYPDNGIVGTYIPSSRGEKSIV